ncbi:2Fe-2S iron-sulfur cluster-binding protein [Faecalibacter rhinopitheci]|uniref:2Fe-2S iron-sulfur cluster binding domain-containing protein n=1 Tax=Faecalibacter rhinopitheci TaxID=2779678 RepID=A0A8J7KH79_9FLAO|nr:2Fe-2S iron-sulfur cluster-binding protein [Faecalibacter rhinopitheci]MBF0596016.1 2Fe-2S iron-sulfur cluster binding domain-containing protein [Faecalibacter rhinopitheci]
MKFHVLKIKSILRLTTDSVQITFDIPEHLHGDFSYAPGQYITLDIDGERRDYSLCTSPLNKEWSIGVKAMPNGKISTKLVFDLKEGNELKVSTPHGRFGIPSKPNEKRTLIAFTAGSGITPILSVAEFTLQTEEWVNFNIFYVNKTENSVMFKEKLAELKAKYPKNINIYNFYTAQNQENFIYNGRIDEKKFDLILNQILDINEVDEAMICGPEEMIITLANKIHTAGIVEKHIHFELFNPSIKQDQVFEKHEDEVKEVSVKVTLDGEENEFIWNREKNLIDAMLEHNIDAPYSCKGGVCSSCMCKVTEGEVNIGDNFVLTDSDYKDGMTLACISRPKTNVLSIDFDDI